MAKRLSRRVVSKESGTGIPDLLVELYDVEHEPPADSQEEIDKARDGQRVAIERAAETITDLLERAGG